MSERLPSIDIAVAGSPRQVLQELAEGARKLGTFTVGIEQNFMGEEGFDIANLRTNETSSHEGLGVQLICRNDLKGRSAVEVRATRWKPNDPPKYDTYCQVARTLVGSVLRYYNSKNGTRYRLRVASRKSMLPKLPPATDKMFKRFVVLANTSVLHPLDWRRFYEFVWHSRAHPLYEEDMSNLLMQNGFTLEYANHIASIYTHLCEFKALR